MANELANLVSRFIYNVGSLTNDQNNIKSNAIAVNSSFADKPFGTFVTHTLNGIIPNGNNDVIINQKLSPLSSNMTIADSIKTLDTNINFVDSKVRVLNQDIKKNTDLTSNLLDFSKKIYNSFSQVNANNDYNRFKNTENKYENIFDEKELEEHIDNILIKRGHTNQSLNNTSAYDWLEKQLFQNRGTTTAVEGAAAGAGEAGAADLLAGAGGVAALAGAAEPIALATALIALLWDAKTNTIKQIGNGDTESFRKFIDQAKLNGYVPGKTYYDPKTGRFLPLKQKSSSNSAPIQSDWAMPYIKTTDTLSQLDWSSSYFDAKPTTVGDVKKLLDNALSNLDWANSYFSAKEHKSNNTKTGIHSPNVNVSKNAIDNPNFSKTLNPRNRVPAGVNGTSDKIHDAEFSRNNTSFSNAVDNLNDYLKSIEFKNPDKLTNIVYLLKEAENANDEKINNINDLLRSDISASALKKVNDLLKAIKDNSNAKKVDIHPAVVNNMASEMDDSLSKLDWSQSYFDAHKDRVSELDAALSQLDWAQAYFNVAGINSGPNMNAIGKRLKRSKGGRIHKTLLGNTTSNPMSQGYQVASLESDIGTDFYEPPKIDQNQINKQFRLNTTEAEESGNAPTAFNGVFTDYSIVSTSFKINSEKADLSFNQNYSLDVTQDVVIKSSQSITLNAPEIVLIGHVTTATPIDATNTTPDQQGNGSDSSAYGSPSFAQNSKRVKGASPSSNNGAVNNPSAQNVDIPNGESAAGTNYQKIISSGPGWVEVQGADGKTYRVTGDRNWRNNNPGNLEYGTFAKEHGAIGSDGRFAIFPNLTVGENARQSLLFDNKSYEGLTVAQAISKYAPARDGNNTTSYIAKIANGLGISPDTPMSSLTDAQRERFSQIQRGIEGFHQGKSSVMSGVSSTSSISPPVNLSSNSLGQLPAALSSSDANYMKIGSQWGNPNSSGWADENLTTIMSPTGKKVTVNKASAPAFEGFLKDLAAEGYTLGDVEGYNDRAIRGSSTISQHAFGNAIDINPGANPMGYGPMKTNLPANIGQLAAKWGLVWGGDFKSRKDPMHFEWMGAPLPQQTTTANNLKSIPSGSNYADLAKKTAATQTAGINLNNSITSNVGNELGQKPQTALPPTTKSASKNISYPSHIEGKKNTHDGVNMSPSWLADYSSSTLV